MTFNLSEKRKELKKWAKITYDNPLSRRSIGVIEGVNKCNKQDKEFIKLLKEGYKDTFKGTNLDGFEAELINKLDNLAGDLI
jgi:hypothetical protein